MFNPLVSVYIPTKNRPKLLLRALNSVVNQTYENIEIIVVDDGSSDETIKLLSELAIKHINLIVFRLDKSAGAPKARNYAIEHAKGELITGLDDDDYFMPERIEKLVASYNSKYAFICSGYFWDYGRVKSKINGSKKIITLQDQLHFNQASNQVLISRQRLLDIGCYDVTFVSCQDWELWTRIIEKYGSALRIESIDYVIDVSHGNYRITDNPARVAGFKKFRDNFFILMTKSHLRSMQFHILVASGEKISFVQLIKLMTLPMLLRNIKYWLSCKFPKIAQQRLDNLK